MNASKLALTIVFTVAASAACSNSHAGEAEKNIARFVGSAALGAGATVALQETEHPVLYGAAVGAAPGVVKEMLDTRTRHGAQGSDLAIGAAGAIAGAVIAGEMLEREEVVALGLGAVVNPIAGDAFRHGAGKLSGDALAVSAVSALVGGPAAILINIGYHVIKSSSKPAQE